MEKKFKIIFILLVGIAIGSFTGLLTNLQAKQKGLPVTEAKSLLSTENAGNIPEADLLASIRGYPDERQIVIPLNEVVVKPEKWEPLILGKVKPKNTSNIFTERINRMKELETPVVFLDVEESGCEILLKSII